MTVDFASHPTELHRCGVQETELLNQMRSRLERSSETTVIEVDLPHVPTCNRSRYWQVPYEIKPMTAAFNALPPVVTLAMELAATTAPPPGISPSAPRPPPRLNPSFALFPCESAPPLQDVAFGALRMALPPPTGGDAADAARRWVAVGVREAAAGRIVPLAPADLPCLVLHGLLHARRPRTARYLRLWLGAGAGALALWETDRTGAEVRNPRPARPARAQTRHQRRPPRGAPSRRATRGRAASAPPTARKRRAGCVGDRGAGAARMAEEALPPIPGARARRKGPCLPIRLPGPSGARLPAPSPGDGNGRTTAGRGRGRGCAGSKQRP
jgi:hypothetical protein